MSESRKTTEAGDRCFHPLVGLPADKAAAVRQAGSRNHPPSYGLSVGQSPIACCRLQSVTYGVTEIEDPPEPRLPLVLSDHVEFHASRECNGSVERGFEWEKGARGALHVAEYLL